MATILIVDDHPVIRQLLVKLLGCGQHTVVEAADGLEALQAVQMQRPDLIITDLAMPRMDGATFVKRLRAEPVGAGIPVIFYTATYRVPHAQALAQEYGVVRIIDKPARADEILSAVSDVLGVAAPPFPHVAPPESDNLRLAAVTELALDLTRETDPRSLVEKFCPALRLILKAASAGVVIVDKETQSVRLVVQRHDEPGRELPEALAAEWAQRLPRLLQTHSSVRVAKPDVEPALLGLTSPAQSFLAAQVPLPSHAPEMAWLYAVDKLDAEAFSGDDEGMAFMLATHLGVAYENARLHAALRARTVELETEIAERNQAEEKLRLQSTALESAANAIVILDIDGTIQWVNPAFTRLTGYSAAEAIGNNPRVLKSGRHSPEFYADLWQTVKAGRVWHHEIVNKRKDGTLYTEEMTITPVANAQGVWTHFIAIKQDVTKRKAVEEALRQSEERLRLLGDNLPDAAVYQYAHETDGSVRFLYVSEGIERLNGVSVADVLRDATVLHRQIPPEYLARLAEAEARSKRDLTDFDMELPMRRPDGQVRWMRLHSRPRRLPDGRTIWDGVQVDVTERKAVEERLRENEQRFRVLVEQAAVGIVLALPDERMLLVNQKLAAMLGYAQQEMIGRSFFDFIQPDDLPDAREHARQLLTGAIDSYTQEKRFLHRDGTPLWMLPTWSAVRAPSGAMLYRIGIIQDLTERKLVEEQIQRYAAELERSNRELDDFAYSASHDLKAPLRAVQNLAQWISEDAGPLLPEESQKHMRLMLQRIDRLERLLDDLLAFSRVGRIQHDPVEIDTARLVAEVVEMLAPPADFTIEVGQLPVLIGQRPPLEQVLRNLIGNAIKHHDRPNGKVTVSAEDRGAMWEFAVGDDGPGIAPQYHEKVFEMFQTLQARDKVEGSGMGLALVKKIVENQGGTVKLESIPGQGATFRFSWPKNRER